jgi:membrane-bound serine protease (ClpP class)
VEAVWLWLRVLRLVMLAAVVTGAAAPAGPTVLAAQVDGEITPVTANYLADAARQAADDGHEALLVELDTPGGLASATRDIVQGFLGAQVPVVVHVAPAGAQAASAGAFIASAAHVAAMAPGTNIGAATPVDAAGDAADEKIINDTAAFAESIAAQRGRNVEFAGQTVREGRAVPAAEAVAIGAVDLVAADRATLLTEIDGRTVDLGTAATATLNTADATVVQFEQGLLRNVQAFLANPTLAFLFLAVGALALLFELVSPGAGIGGITGAILVVLGLTGLAVLPVNAAGVVLLVLAVGLLVAELFAPGVGVFAAGGAIALGLAGVFLFDGQQVNPVVLWPTVLLVGAGAVLAGRLALRAGRARPVTGQEALVGQWTVVSETSGNYRGRARLHGTSWTVRSRGGALRDGQDVQVVELDGNTLVVDPSLKEDPS